MKLRNKTRFILSSLFVIWTLLPLWGQDKEIRFNQVLKEALMEAKQADKLIFADCYTTWCVPCKYMDQYVFKNDTIADFMNEKFVNVKLDMETPDNRPYIGTYKIGAFPTFLILNKEGGLVYKFVGSMPPSEFLNKIKQGMESDNPVALMNSQYDQGVRTPAFIRTYIQEKFNQKEVKFAKQLVQNYVDSSSAEAISGKYDWFLFAHNGYTNYISNPGSNNFKILIGHRELFEKNIGQDTVRNRIKQLYRDLAKNCMNNQFQTQYTYHPGDFDYYRQMLQSMTWQDKNICLLFVDIAEQACKGNKNAVSDIIADHIAYWGKEDQRIAYDYWWMCMTGDPVPMPRRKEISEKIIRTSQDTFLITTAKTYLKD